MNLRPSTVVRPLTVLASPLFYVGLSFVQCCCLFPEKQYIGSTYQMYGRSEKQFSFLYFAHAHTLLTVLSVVLSTGYSASSMLSGLST